MAGGAGRQNQPLTAQPVNYCTITGCIHIIIVTTEATVLLYNCFMIKPTVYDALKQMRKLSDDNIPFSISFVSCNLSKETSDGVKTISKAKLRVGLSADKGIKSQSLIGYIDLDTNKQRWFYLPLLLTFNQIQLR